jgi:DNA polymerase-3 subunit beta
MKISINKNELQTAIQKLSKATPNRSTLPILSCVLLQTNNNEIILRSTDLEITIIISISASVEKEGSSAIPIHTLINITNELPDGRITIEIDDQHKIKLITELGTYNLMGKPAEEFPAVPEIDKEKPLPIKSDLLSEIIKSTSFVISHDELKPALTGLYLKLEKNRLTTVATDGHQLVRYIVSDYVTDGFTGEVIIPRKFLSLLGSLLADDDKTQL